MLWMLVKAGISAAIIVAVSEIARRAPRMGAFLLTLPVVSVLAILATWLRDHNLKVVSQLSRETLILVPLGLPLFVPLAFAAKFGWDFWIAMAAGLLLASITVGTLLLFGPSSV